MIVGERHTVGVVGARGHTGAELVRIIGGHPGLELVFAGSRELAGQPVPGLDGHVFESIGPEDLAGREVDVVVLALPDGAARDFRWWPGRASGADRNRPGGPAGSPAAAWGRPR